MLEDLFIDHYELMCQKMRDILSKRKELEAEYKELREDIIANVGGDRMEYGIKVTKRERAGAIDYKRMIEDGLIDESSLEYYKKPNIEVWEIRSY